jgi:hypothetical protein
MSIAIPKEKLQSLDVVEYLKKGFEFYKGNFVTLLLGFIISMAITIVSLGILGGAMLAGYIRLCVRLTKPNENKTPPKPTDVFEGFNVFLPALILFVGFAIVNFVISLILGSVFGIFGDLVGFLVSMILGGLLFSIAMPMIALEKTDEPKVAALTAIEFFKAAPIPLSLLFIASGIAGYLGVFILVIGMFLTMPFTISVSILLHNSLFTNDEEVTVMEAA